MGRARGWHAEMDRREILECESSIRQLPDLPRDGGQARWNSSTATTSRPQCCTQGQRTLGTTVRRIQGLGRGRPRRLPLQTRRTHEAVFQHHHPERPAPPLDQLLLQVAPGRRELAAAFTGRFAPPHPATEEHVPRVNCQRVR
jgi:hypothetical protein